MGIYYFIPIRIVEVMIITTITNEMWCGVDDT
jgi:hypothetical protein